MNRSARTSSQPGMATFLAEVGVAAALSFILSRLKVYQMPQGGSVSLEALPVLYVAFMRGAKQGVAAGFVTGILQMLLGGDVRHPIQAMLDYPIASLVVGLAPIFAVSRGTLGVIIGTIGAFALQLISFTLSGAVFFAEYAPEGVSPWAYSVGYNASYLVPELIISAIVIAYLVSRSSVARGSARHRG